jgi:ribosome-associated toxin RatA of RatAB toxin-antitoxin module
MATRIQRSAIVPYGPRQMFDLVNDVEAYPEFVPYCRSAHVLEVRGDAVKATIELAKGALHKSFTTINQLQAPESIRLQLVEGPFRRLHGTWNFDKAQERGTRIALDLEFEFSNRLIALALGPVFNQLANTLVDAFVRRAHQVYGRTDG